jgi:hypothetical protein
MTDLIYIALITGFFLLGLVYLAGCEALGRKGVENK